MSHIWEFLLILLLVSVWSQTVRKTSGNDLKTVCYVQRTSYMPMSNIPAKLCTHLIFAFAKINKKGKLVPDNDKDKSIYKELVAMKNTNPDLRLMISVQQGFDFILNRESSFKERFAESVIAFLKNYNFEGLDLDWEPLKFPLSPSTVSGYAEIIQVLRDKMQENYLLSAALYANIDKAKNMYNVSQLGEILDFATIMTYDYHLYSPNKDTITGYNSPLYTAAGEPWYWSVNQSTYYYYANKFPTSKMLMGFPTYGRTFKLGNSASHGLHAPAISRGDPGPIRGLRGIFSYQDTCVTANYSKRVFDNHSFVPYMFNKTTWLSFDDQTSAFYKCSFVKDNALGGVGIWAVHLDDYNAMCKEGLFPLISYWRTCLNDTTGYLKKNFERK